jgi:poly(A) polymerase
LRDLLATVQVVVPDAFLVGGAVRDLLTRRSPVDLDLVTRFDAREVARALAGRLGASPFPLDEVRRTWRVVLSEGLPAREIDISSIEGSLDADLLRRDFTIDALAAPIDAGGTLGDVLDVCGGLQDLSQRRLRMVSEDGLRDDPLRLLRTVRLATELGFEIEAATASAIRRLATRLDEAAAERRRDELLRILATPRSAQGIRLMDSLGLLDVLLPEMAPARGVDQPPNHHYWDVFDHSIETLASLDVLLSGAEPEKTKSDVSLLKRDAWFRHAFRRILGRFDIDAYLDARSGATPHRVLIKLAGLLHDISKPETKSVEADGRVRFLGHSEQGAIKAHAICTRLRFSGRETAFVAKLVEEHLRPAQLSSNHDLPSARALHRFFRDLGEAAPGCLFLSLADASAAAGPRLQPERWRGHVAYAAYVLENGLAQAKTVTARPRLVTGADLIEALGLEPGPRVGGLLALIDEAVATGEVSTREEALALAREETSPPAAASPSPTSERGIDPQASSTEKQRWWQASPDAWQLLKPLVREKRREPTPAEAKLWKALRRNQLDGLRFRRQHAIDRYIVDFYCPAARLVVEVDGPIHEATETEDLERQEALEKSGLRVVRFSNEEVMERLPGVVERIKQSCSGQADHEVRQTDHRPQSLSEIGEGRAAARERS